MLEMAIGQSFRKGTHHSLVQLDPRLRSLGLVPALGPDPTRPDPPFVFAHLMR